MNFNSNKYFSKIIYANTYIKQKNQMDKSEVDKLEQAIDVHRYRGASKKKHNGVVPIRPEDKELWKAIKKFKDVNSELLNNSYNFFADIKVVAHVENGNRAIGSIYVNDNNELILYMLGFANYNYQLF